MKNLFLLSLISCFFLSFSANAQSNTFNKVKGSAYDITIDQTNGTAIVAGRSGRIFKWNEQRKNWDLIAKPPSPARKVSCYYGNQLYIIGKDAYVYKQQGIKWKKLTGFQALDLGIGKDGKLMIVNKQGNIMELLKSGPVEFFSLEKTFPKNIKFNRIAVLNRSNWSAVARNGKVYHVTNKKQKRILSGSVRNLAYNNHGQLFVAGKRSGKAWYWGNNKWQNVSAKYQPFHIASGKKATWLVQKNGGIYTKKAVTAGSNQILSLLDASEEKIEAPKPKKKPAPKPKKKQLSKTELLGEYKVTIEELHIRGTSTKIFAQMIGGDLSVAEYYGVMGIRAYHKTKTDTKTITARAGAKPRVWDVSKKNPKQSNVLYSSAELKVYRSRNFIIEAHHLDDKYDEVEFNIQANLGEVDPLFNDKFKFSQISLNIMDLNLSKGNVHSGRFKTGEKGKENKIWIEIKYSIKRIE